jgi:hypothetical protein
MTIENGNYTATVTKKTDGYGDQVFSVKVLCMTGTHVEGDVLFLKNYDKESVALRAAKRELAKRKQCIQ